ncbi:unnamed protein product [Mytilus edulis]|uniref:Uncharacterized protein n=1 Tax=Mytilus edulis TaxID=6550 RepID=A0A8S3SJE7_MYTED|nr:unnamed protein product [Mytilus edulis]
MSRSASITSNDSFASAIDSNELTPIASSTVVILDEKQDPSTIKSESDGKKSNVPKDHKCCLLIATIVFIVFLCIFFIIIYSNRSEPTREYSSVSGNCANCSKENKTDEKDISSKVTVFDVTLWERSMTVIIQTHGPLAIQLNPYEPKTTLVMCRNNSTSFELFCNSQTKQNCQSVPVNKLVTIRNETKDEQIIFDIVVQCINKKIGIKWRSS